MVVRIASSQPVSRTAPSVSYTEISDDDLVSLFQSGDALAFHYLIDRHRGLIRTQVNKFFGPSADAEDITQDVVLSLWQRRDAWKPGAAKFSTWLYRVVANRCIDIIRQKRETAGPDGLDDIVSGMMSAEERISESQMAAHLKDLLSALPEQQKMALKLFYYDDANIETICNSMNLSDQAVRSLLKRAKQKLRASMQTESYAF